LFFRTVFMQAVWGDSALKTGVAYLPLTAVIMVASGAAASSSRGSAPGRCCWPAPRPWPVACTGCRGSRHSSYAGGVLGPMLVIAPLACCRAAPLVAMSRVRDEESASRPAA